MRIISQDGTIDVPYETSILHIATSTKAEYSKSFIFYTPNNSMDSNELARYSTEAKAQKAMEMLREQYAHMKRVECMSVSLASCELTTLSNKDAKLLGDEVQKLMCFQFPKDEDVEV